MEIILYVCLCLMLVFGVAAVMIPSMLRSSIALAAVSISLGIIMYTLGAVSAAMFEISVCSGLVTVIFICAISLSNIDKKDLEKVFENKKRMVFLPVVLITVGVILVVFALSADFSLPLTTMAAEAEAEFREILWNQRQADIWGQMIIAIAGAFAIVVLF